MDKTKKYLSFLIFPLLFLLLVFLAGKAHAATDVTDKAKIDNLKITVASTGSVTEGIHGSNDTSMALKYSGDFSFPNVAVNEIEEGDYFIVRAPVNLNLVENTMDLIDSTSNIKMGTVQADNANHRLVFTFNNEIKDKQNIRGNFVAKASESLSKDGKKVTYVLPNGTTQVITYKVNTYNIVDVIGETIIKYGYNDTNKARAHFQMKINRAKEDMTGHVVKITDDVSKGAFANYVEGTFYLNEAEFQTTNKNSSALKHMGDRYEITTDPEVYKANSDKKALLTFVNGKRGFELLMPTNMGRKSFFLTYDTSSPADASTISNSAQYLIDNQPQLTWKKYGNIIGTKTEEKFNLKTVKSVGASITADIAGKIKITKFDEADATIKLAGVVFEIREKTTNNLVDTVTTDADGIAVSNALNNGKYIVKEKTPKSGYQVNSQEFEVEMKDGKGIPLNISNKRVTVDFEATKTWVNGKATDYKEVKLGLYVHKEGQTVADAKPVTGNYTPEVTVSNGVYTYKWKNQLPERDVDGSKLVYSVRELEDQTGLPLKEGEKVKAGENNYLVSYNADKTQVTNTYEVPKTNVTAKKVWVGGQETVRPTVYFKLYRTPEGGAIEEVVGVSQKEVPKTDGTVEWTDLPATDEHGVKYTYSVMEVDEDGNLIVDPIDGYTPSQTAGLTVTNTYSTSQTKADIKVKKELTGGRPTPLQNEEFEFILKDKNGQEVKRAKNDANGDVVFKDIPFTQEGHYQYTIVEANAGQTIDGVTHDARTVRVTVHVYDNGKGQLVAWVENFDISSVAIPLADFASSALGSALVPPISGAINTITDAGIQTFVNTYKATNAKAVLEVTKQLTGRATGAQENEFEFTLTDQAGNVETKKNDAAGKVKFDELTFDEAGTYTYTIKEVKAGTTENGITYDSKIVTAKVTVTDDGHGKLTAVVDYSSDPTFTNVYTPAGATTVTLGAKKVLEGKALEAGKYSFVLKKEDGTVVETATNAADGSVTFAPISYDESQVGTHKYTISEVEGDETGITYDKTVQEVEVKVEKVSATELKATASKEAKDLVFKNVYTPSGATSVTLGAKKVLEGKTLEAGKYSFELKKEDGTVVETATNAADGTVTFSPISYDESQVGTHKYTISEVAGNEPGVTYDTTVQEVEVKVEKVSATELKATASKEAKDLVFKNVYTPAKTEVRVNKIWKDADNQDGKRPSSITVKLLADGQETNQTLVLNAANNWAGSFTNLDTDKGGASIKYTVVEEPVTGYTSEVTGDATSGFIITNTYTPETVDVTVTKNWKDNNDQDGKRPSSITVNLLADGTKVDSREIQAATDGTWTAKFEKLAKYKDGKEIKYTVTEESVVGYKSSIDNFTITNSHDPEKINISGTKVWNDNNDQDGKRPSSITVQVLKGETVVEEMEVSAETGWKFEFKDLPKYENGTEITYVLKEVSVEHYTTEVTGKDGKYTITNTHTPAKIDVKGQKIWDDANDKDGIRPDSIVVKLLANGVDTGKTATSSAASGWTYEFTDLDRYQDGGKEIVYTIKESYVPKGYTSEVIGANIVNHHKPKDPEPNKPQDLKTNKASKTDSKPQLPKTGEEASSAIVVTGLALMVITGGLYFVSRKND